MSINIDEIFKKYSYLEAYKNFTDLKVKDNPKEAVGGMWDEIGNLQFNYLVKNGLLKNHSLLDIGCGTLRGGRHFIKYLDANKYTGVDISTKAIEYSNELIDKEELRSKNPTLVINKEMNLIFSYFKNEKFDFILAQSVFTHLMPEHIEECIKHIGNIMKNNANFFFTAYLSENLERTGIMRFCYPYNYFQQLSKKFNFNVEIMNDYNHPRNQVLIRLIKD